MKWRDAVTEDVIERLYTAKKFVPQKIKWKGFADGRYKFKVKAYLEDESAPLELRGVKNTGTKYSFTLLYLGNIVVRGFDMCQRHNNIGEGITIYQQPHKHKYVDAIDPRYAYVVDDISCNDVNQGLIDFLDECNIELLQPYQGILQVTHGPM